jgi:hypothetical protein
MANQTVHVMVVNNLNSITSASKSVWDVPWNKRHRILDPPKKNNDAIIIIFVILRGAALPRGLPLEVTVAAPA